MITVSSALGTAALDVHRRVGVEREQSSLRSCSTLETAPPPPPPPVPWPRSPTDGGHRDAEAAAVDSDRD